ncbi:MAG: hemerythrin domain-containing protein, partial [Acidobacteria bacterium]|nr:hemerythrin domain-containing protein [Acidobacteriota bacterium]
MNAIELLKQDHDKVDKLFQKVKGEQGDTRELFEQIRIELEVHTQIEEKVFYPYLLENGDEELKKITEEGLQEHHQAKILLREIENLAEDSDTLDPKLQVLMEDITHHVQEEEGEMFPMVQQQFDEETLAELGEDL